MSVDQHTGGSPAAITSSPLIQIENLKVEYLAGRGSVRAVDGVSLHINRGEVVGLAGESGSGKSTIAQAIMRILQPPAVITGGKVMVDGKDVLAMSDRQLREHRRARHPRPVLRLLRRDQIRSWTPCSAIAR